MRRKKSWRTGWLHS